MLHEHYLDLIDDVAALVAELDSSGDDAASDKLASLLRQIDLMHREGLIRLVDGLRTHGAGPILDRVIDEDPIVRIVLGLYGLADLQLPTEEEMTETLTNHQPPTSNHQAAPTSNHQPPATFFPIERLTVHRAKEAHGGQLPRARGAG